MTADAAFLEATGLVDADLTALVLALWGLAAKAPELGSKVPTVMASATERWEK